MIGFNKFFKSGNILGHFGKIILPINKKQVSFAGKFGFYKLVGLRIDKVPAMANHRAAGNISLKKIRGFQQGVKGEYAGIGTAIKDRKGFGSVMVVNVWDQFGTQEF